MRLASPARITSGQGRRHSAIVTRLSGRGTLAGGMVNPMRSFLWILGTFALMLVCGAGAVWLSISVLAPMTQNVEGPFPLLGVVILGSGIIGALTPLIAILYLRKGDSPWRFDLRSILTLRAANWRPAGAWHLAGVLDFLDCHTVRWEVHIMFGIGPLELLVMLLALTFSIGVPVATLVLVVLIYRNTRK